MGNLPPILVIMVASAFFLLNNDNYDAESIRNKRILVTGASSGIGEQLAYHYSELGARVVLAARRTELLQRVAVKCKQLGAKEVSFVPADLSETRDRYKLITEASKLLGGLDHLILNHAEFHIAPWRSSPENMSVLHSDMNTNFFSYVELASLALPMLIESKGRIGVVSSLSGKYCTVLQSIYSSSKFALQGFFSSWSQELEYKETGVSVTLVILGLIATEKAIDVSRVIMPNFDVKGFGASPKDTAVAIVRAVETRVYELYYPWKAKVALWVHHLLPESFERCVSETTI